MDESRLQPVLPPGSEIGGCQIVRLVGSGGMGQVYLAQHFALQKPVAVKILPPDWGNAERVKRFFREARTCSRIEHPNVITIHDVGSENGLHYIIMQYVDGKNLAQLVKEQGGPLHWRAAGMLVRETAKGLAAVHKNGLIHRDIKPHNIMLSSDGRVLLMDFGLVRDESETRSPQTQRIVGTLGYMSPEQLSGKPLDLRTDIFSLGSTCYYLLTGGPPYRGNLNDVANSIAAGNVPDPVHEVNHLVPHEISAIVARAMAPHPRDRFSDARSMAKSLSQTLKDQSIMESIELIDAREPAPQVLETLPVSESLVDLQLESPLHFLREHRRWIYGGVLLGATLLLGLVLNLVFLRNDSVGNAANGKAGMVRIAPGMVRMGDDRERVINQIQSYLDGEPEAHRLARAARRLRLDSFADEMLETQRQAQVKAFWIDQYEVTNAQYAEFVQATNYEFPDEWDEPNPPQGKEDHPVENIHFQDAEAYAKWAGKKLPTSEQWIRAFRGDQDRLFPWGDRYDPDRANTADGSHRTTTPIRATPDDVSPFGVYNLVGNVGEFVRGSGQVAGEPKAMVKGASYALPGHLCGVGGIRYDRIYHDEILLGVGFRCVIEEP